MGTPIAGVACLVRHHSHTSAHFRQQDGDIAREAGMKSKKTTSCILLHFSKSALRQLSINDTEKLKMFLNPAVRRRAKNAFIVFVDIQTILWH